MAGTPELQEVSQLYFSQAPRLFALCYLHTGGPKGANALLHTLLCDLLLSPRCWKQASSGNAGLFRWAQGLCMDRYWNRPRRKRKKNAPPSAPGPSLPFTMTDSLRALLDLPPKYKAPLYLRLALGWSLEDTARAAGCSPKRAESLVERGLKKAKLAPERAAEVLSSIAPTESGPQEIWDSFLVSREDRGFAGSQRLRRFKRWLDSAIPFIALGVVSLCVLAYCSVEYGWFGADVYTPTPSDGYEAGLSSLHAEKGTATIFSVAEEGIVQYNVTDCPLDPETLIGQMVALGGAPEGTYVLSAQLEDGRLTLELSEEASQIESREMMGAMAATFAATYPDLQELHLVSAGKELDVWEHFPQKMEPVRTVTTPYHE